MIDEPHYKLYLVFCDNVRTKQRCIVLRDIITMTGCLQTYERTTLEIRTNSAHI